ncbi:synaptosomal-associated protein 29 [Drosophila innubila]|uniref:synaptosomal-associated protein 29 n=1 Tax=Drosophila innubila TaxID=198719 RepID=UPI00148CD33D|nr:synaptosomal-associated protein 29 [Drosophila innubila]
MANNYLQPVNNHFDDKLADVDDDLFLKNTRSNKPQRSTNPFDNNDDDVSTSSSISAQRQAYAEKRREIEQRTLDSTQKSLGLLYETEEVGKATAVELARQREQLEKTSNQLDEINSTLRFSQRHLNGLKSVFGGLKNYLSGSRDQPPTATGSSPTGSQSSQETNCNAGAAAVNFDGSKTKGAMSPTERYDNHPVSRLRDDSSASQLRQVQQQKRAGDPFQKQLESNLDDMCDNLSRLKFLATDLGTEIESQNDLLDNMNYKIEIVDSKIVKQNKDVHKLLKK